MDDPQTNSDAQLFRDLFNASPIGIVVESLEGRPAFANPAFCSFLGLTEEEVRNKHCVDFSPGEDAEKDWALFKKLRAGSIDHYQLEKRYFRKDGSLVWGNLTISVLKGSGSSPLVLAMVQDITEKKAAEAARFRHAAIVESSEDAIASVTLEGVIETWNRGAQRLFGYTESEAVGKSFKVLVPPERPDEEKKILETLKAGGRLDQFETTRVTKMGKRIEVSLSVSPIKDSSGKTVGFSGISRDITERKRAEQAILEVNRALEAQATVLQSREELLKTFVKNVPAGVAMLDREMRYLQVSDRFCTDYSLDSSRLLGRSHYELFPDIPDRWKEVHRRALEGETLRADEDRWDRKGDTTWVRWEVRPWRRADGSSGGILIFAEDVTRRKQMEEALSGMTRKLIESQEEERTRIARELHDDINQRLALIAVNLESLHGASTSSVPELFREIREAKTQIDDLASDVQALSHRLHSSKLEYLGLAAAAASLCRELSERQRLKIHFNSENLPKDLPKEISLCLFRVLQEALQNAVKHSGSRQFQVSLTGRPTEIELMVRDSGVGFNPDEKKEDGLGLTSIRERLRLVSGNFFIDSQPQHGTTIHARVPLHSRTKSAALSG